MSSFQAQQNYSHSSRSVQVRYRNMVISQLQQDHSIVMLVASNLHNYMDSIRELAKKSPDIGPEEIKPDNRFNHVTQVQERLRFLRYFFLFFDLL